MFKLLHVENLLEEVVQLLLAHHLSIVEADDDDVDVDADDDDVHDADDHLITQH